MKPTKKNTIYILAIIVLAVAAYIGGKLSVKAPAAETAGDHTEHASKEPTIWTCSMHPQIKLPKPGKCPICFMDLIPLESSDDDDAGARNISVSPYAAKLMELETAPVMRRFMAAEVRMVGKVDYDETKVSYISAWVPGRIDRLFVDYTGIPVKKGEHMVELYSPELLTAQQELLQAIETLANLKDSQSTLLRETAEQTVVAAREKLRLWGFTADQIKEIETRGTPSDHMTIYAPAGGIVIHKNAQEGMYVQTGTRIYTIANLSKVWVQLDAYESDLDWLRYGQKVTFTTESLPGETFEGTIAFIDPVLNPATRTVSVRVNVDNRDLKMKPGMFVRATAHPLITADGKVANPSLENKWICPMHPEIVKDESGDCDICGMPLVTAQDLGYVMKAETTAPLVIPASAPLLTGVRAIVYVEVPDTDKPTYEGREIVLGRKAGDYYVVKSGLKEGERVVTKGNFKLDAELQIRAKPSMMTPEGGGGGGMHHHGDMGSEGGGQHDMSAEEMKEMAAPITKLPHPVQQQLLAVRDAARQALTILSGNQPKEAASVFQTLTETIGRVDASAIPPDILSTWSEAAMFLGNDAVIGKAIDAKTDLDDLKKQLQTHLNYLEQRLGLSGMTAATVSTSGFGKELKDLVGAYLAMQTALASDQFEPAKEAVETARSALGAVPMEKLSGAEHMQWMKQAESLKATLGELAKAQDVEAFRVRFASLSDTMTAIIRTFPPADAPLYVFHCPMALDNQGADWLQDNDQTTNPYYGSSMLACGDLTEQINAMKDEMTHDHE